MYLFVRSSTNPGPRVARIINYFTSKNKDVVYLSPTRFGDDVSNEYRDLGDLGQYDYFDGNGYFRYLVFLLKVNLLIALKIFKNRKKIKLVHFSDLEVVILGGLLCTILRIKYIYNIHDNFFQRYAFSNKISSFLKSFESLFIKMSDKTLVPEIFRKTAYPVSTYEKIHIFRNYPDFDVTTNRVPFLNGSITLFYGGWISPNRNLNQFKEIAKCLRDSGYVVKFNLCGWGDTSYLEELREAFVNLDVEFNYLGQLSQKEAVTYLKESDVSIAYYNPEKIINVFAASNKIPEIIGSNTILVTNNHTEIAKEILDNGVSLQFDLNVEEVIPDLISLIDSKENVLQFVNRSKDFYLKKYNPANMASDLKGLFHESV